MNDQLIIGQKMHHIPGLDSTNAFAAEWSAKTNPVNGTVITTDFQTAGRGQIGRNWHSEAGKNLLCSIVFYPNELAATNQFSLAQWISLGITDLLDAYGLSRVSIKWPNDVYVGDKKIAGVLIQNSLQGALIKTSIIGVGMNINQTVFPDDLPNPTSLTMELGREYSRDHVLRQLCSYWNDRADLIKDQRLTPLYTERLYRLNEAHSFYIGDKAFTGIIRGIDPTGKLAVETNNEIQFFGFREISFVNPTA